MVRLGYLCQKKILRVDTLPFYNNGMAPDNYCVWQIVRLKQTKFGKFKYISSIKLMQATEVSEQRYVFREVKLQQSLKKPDEDMISVIL